MKSFGGKHKIQWSISSFGSIRYKSDQNTIPWNTKHCRVAGKEEEIDAGKIQVLALLSWKSDLQRSEESCFSFLPGRTNVNRRSHLPPLAWEWDQKSLGTSFTNLSLSFICPPVSCHPYRFKVFSNKSSQCLRYLQPILEYKFKFWLLCFPSGSLLMSLGGQIP